MSDQAVAERFLESTRKELRGLKRMAERALAQLNDDDLAWRPDAESNSIAINIQHLHGNMMSRWTDMLTADGEKPTRQRDAEFIQGARMDRQELMRRWEEGWARVFETFGTLRPDDLLKEVRLRGRPSSVLETLQGHISHYAYHIGQMVFIAKRRKGQAWQTLSIPRGMSRTWKPKPGD